MTCKSLFNTFLISLFASIAFILIQPLFGMATLTSRHAEAYNNLGGYSEFTAISLSWIVHVSVSVAYGFLSALIYHFNRSIIVTLAQIVILGWVTTLIATPANEWVIKFITTGQLTSISSLSQLNTELGAKFWLHILFFVLIVSGLWLAKVLSQMKALPFEKDESLL